MSTSDEPTTTPLARPPLSWPPPGLERLQGGLWVVMGLAWTGALTLVLPLLWALAIEQPFYSLGPFEENWRIGTGIALVGATIVSLAFGHLFLLTRTAARAAELGYGTLTILQVASDYGRDTGFLIQGKRHFGTLDADNRSRVTRHRLRGAVLLLLGAIWLGAGFGLGIVLAARGFVTPSGVSLLTLAPSTVLTALGFVFLVAQNTTVREVQSEWNAQEGANRVRIESQSWNERLDEASGEVVLGAGRRGEARRYRAGATVVAVVFVLTFAPPVTVALTTAIGPILAEIAVPTFLAVQEMAGGAEILRRFRLPSDGSVSPTEAGQALQNLAFVGSDDGPEPAERAPVTAYPTPWFPDAGSFPDPFSEDVARMLVARPIDDFTPREREALRAAAAHPANAELERLSHAEGADIVSARWVLPFPDTLSFRDLPWPRFPALRAAGLAQVAKAAVELAEGRAADAERTLRRLITAGFLLIDEGPTLIDNLMGVELTRMGADGLESLYRRSGRPDQADALAWARQGALAAAGKARAGLAPADARALLQGVPALVENEEALRGLRWEYFATFNLLAPCINVQRMVFGPGDNIDEWRRRAERAIVRGPGEQALFDLAEHGALAGRGTASDGVLPRLLGLVLGRGGASGSCASLIAALES